jgi:hypothetical protein
MPKKNNPGCGCCEPPCDETLCGDATTEDIREIEWEIDLPNTFVWWFNNIDNFGTPFWSRIVGTGFANFNGTYIVTRILDPCGWEFSESDEYDIEYIIYRHEYDGVFIPGTIVQCPSSGYISAQTIVVPTKGVAQISQWVTNPYLFFGNPFASVFLQVGFSAWQQGTNMRGPCESSSLTYDSFSERIGVGSLTMQDFVDQFGTCSGQFVNYQGTATFTPTLA